MVRLYYLQQMGIPLWQPRPPSPLLHPDLRCVLISEASENPGDHKAQILLKQMLSALALQGSVVHTLLFYPTQNNDHLTHTITSLAPRLKAILVLGEKAAQWFCNSQEPLQVLRGTAHAYQGIPCLPSFSPHHLLQHGQDKKQAYQDWCQAKEQLQSA